VLRVLVRHYEAWCDNTVQILEDIGLMKMLPGMTVINTCGWQSKQRRLTIAIADYDRFICVLDARTPVFYTSRSKFEIGKAVMINEGTDTTIVATGHSVWEATSWVRSWKN
jgi:transketolase